MNLPRFLTARLALFVLLGSCSALASTVERLEIEDLCDRADQIFLGTVVDAPRSLDQGGEPVTRVRLAVSRALKGGVGPIVEVLLPGGTLDGERHQILGMPRLHAGEEVVLFLSVPDARGRRWPIGLSQAKFTVVRHAGRPATVRRHLDGLRRLSPGAAQRPAPDRELKLRHLLQRIEARLDTSQVR